MTTTSHGTTDTDTDALVTEHLSLVQHVVNGLAGRYPRHVDRSELWSAGALGIVDAARRYDVGTGIPFPRYAPVRIRGAIIDSTRSRDWATRSLRRTMREVRDVAERFEDTRGRSATDAELAGLLGLTLRELAEHRSHAAAATLLQLDQQVPGTDGATLGDGIAEREEAWLPEEATEQRELVGTVRTAVAFLPQVQREVVNRYYFNGEMLREIADSMGLTEARISQIRTEAITAMRAYFGTAFEGVPEVSERAAGVRQRSAYVAAMSTQSTWRSRLDAADVAPDTLTAVAS